MAGGTFAFGGQGGTFAFGNTSLSPTQAASVQQAQAQKPAKSILGDLESAGSGILHGSTSALGAALGYLMRPSAAVDTALTQAALHPGQGWGTFGAAAHGLKLGITGKSHDTFSDFIRAAYPKFAAHHKTSTALLGFGGTIITDPTLPLIIGAQAIPGVNLTVDQAEAARLADLLGTGLTSEAKAAQAQATIDAIDKAVGTATEHGFTARKALAQIQLERATLEGAGKVPSFALDSKYAAATEAAKVESEQALQKVLQLKYAIPFSGGKSIPLSPTAIGGLRVAPRIPSLKGVAEAGVPLVSKGANFVGEAFKHGWHAPEIAKPTLAASTKAHQYITSHLMRYAHVRMEPHFRALTTDQIHKAFDFGETRNGIVRGSSQGRTLNESMLKKAAAHGELSPEQVAFIRDWHDTMEHTRKLEESFGIRHEGSVGNILYVPHRFMRDGGFITKPALKTNFGFAKERQNLTLGELRAAQAGGRFESHNLTLVDNPAEILARRLEEGGNAMSQHALTEVLAHTAGVPKLVPDLARRRQALTNVRALMKKQRGLTHIMDTAGTKRSLNARHGAMVRAATKAILDKHQVKLDAIDAQIEKHSQAAETATKHVVPPSKARGMSAKTFKAQVSHMRQPDRVEMVKIHARMVEGKNLEARLAKLKNVKGGPQNAAKKLAQDVATYTGREVKKGTERGDSWKSAISDALFAERKNLQGEYHDVLKKYQSGKAFDHGKAVNRLLAQRERVIERAAKQIDAAKFRVSARKGQALEDWQKTFDRQAKQYTNLQAQIEREQRAYEAMKRNPNIPEGWIELDKKLAGGRYFFHPEVHDALTRVDRAVNNPGVMQSVANGYRKLLGAWKIGATSANPGYRVRNTASDVWNMYIAGVPMPRVVQFGKRAAALQITAHRAAEKLVRGELADITPHEMQALRDLAEMQLHGILSGLFQGDIQEVARMFHAGTKARDYLREGKLNPLNLGKAYIKATQDWNRHGENWGRITHYLYRRQYQGLSAQKAADWVKRAHFDYEELTPFEQNVMKSIFPFYTWTRKDIPYQLTQMVSRPGKYASFPKAIYTSNELATGNPHTPDQQQSIMPSWMRQNYMFRVPGGEYINPNIGVQDLGVLEHPLSQGIGQHLNPLGQVLAAALTGKNPGTGQDIVGTHPRNPVSGIGADLLRLIPGSNVGPTERTVRGQVVQGEGANPWYTFAAQQIPFVNFLINQESPIKQAERGGALNSPLAYLGGVSLYHRDLQAEQTAAQLNFQDTMKKILRGQRDTGQLAPVRPKKLSPYQIALNKLINQGG